MGFALDQTPTSFITDYFTRKRSYEYHLRYSYLPLWKSAAEIENLSPFLQASMFDTCKGADLEEIGFTGKPFPCSRCICLASTNFSCKTNKFELRRNTNECSTPMWIAPEKTSKEMIPNTVCEIGRTIGSGGFGTVYEASLEGKKLAVKKMHRNVKNPHALYESVQAEKLVLPLRHPNIVRTLAVLERENLRDVWILMEFAGHRTLQSIIDDDRQVLESSRRCQFVRDVACALKFVHENSLVHLDLKPANVIVDGQDVCKLGDFGCCQSLELTAKDELPLPPSPSSSPKSLLTGTFAYRAPELLKGELPTIKADMYSLGICLWQMLTREQPYGLESHFVVIFGVVAHHLRPSLANLPPSTSSDKSTPAYIGLMKSLWQARPVDRPTAQQVLQTLNDIETT